eukprot:s6266_g4.t1
MESAGHVKLPLPSMPQAAVTKALRRVYCSAGVKLIVNNNCKAGRQKLERLLLQSLWLDIWKAAGITVQSLGSHQAASSLFSEVERLHSEDLPAIQERYKALDLPLQQVQDRRWVLQRVSESLFWEALPLADLWLHRCQQNELLEECEMRALPINPAERDADHAAETKPVLVRRLVKDSCIRAWVKMGIPVARLGDARAVALVAEEWQSLENIGSADLKIKCELHGVPPDAALERHDLLQLLKDIAVWESMPLHELKAELAKVTGAEQPGRAAASVEVRRGLRSQGHPSTAHRLFEGCCEARAGQRRVQRAPALLLTALCSGFFEELKDLEAQDTASLKAECQSLGLPELRDLHRELALWRALPCGELRLECRARNVPCPQPQGMVMEQELKEMLVDALLVEKCEAWYERRGVPVRRLGSVSAAARVSERWEQLDQLSEGGLLFKASAFSIHVDKDLKRSEVMERIKQAILWSELPMRELQKVCRENGVNSVARENQKKELMHRLASALWPPPPPEPPKPPPTFHNFGSRDWQRSFKKNNIPPPSLPKNINPKTLVPHFKTLGLAPNASPADTRPVDASAERKAAGRRVLDRRQGGGDFTEYCPDRGTRKSIVISASKQRRGGDALVPGASSSSQPLSRKGARDRMEQLQAQIREKEASIKELGEAQNAAMARADAAADSKQEAEARVKLAEQALRTEQALREDREKKLEAIRNSQGESEEKSSKYKQEVTDLQIELSLQKGEVASLREQLSLAQEERDAQQADAQSRTQAYQGLQEMVAGLEKQLADSQRRKVAAENRFAAEEACRKAAEDRCAGAEKRHVQDEELAESLAAALHEAKQSLMSMEANREVAVDQASVEERAARQRAESLQKALQKEIESLKESLASAETKAAEAEARAQDLQKRLATSGKKLEQAQQAQAVQAPDSPSRKEQAEVLARKEVEVRNHELQKRLAASEAKAKKAEQAEEGRKEAEARAQETQQRLSLLEAEVTELREAALAFKDAEKQFQDSQKKEGLKIEAAEAGCAAAEARVAQLQNQVSDLESELARVKAAESLQEVHLAVKKDAEAHAEDLQNQLSDMEAHLEEVHQVRADKEKAEQKLQSLQERCAVIEEDMASAKAAADEQAQELSRLEPMQASADNVNCTTTAYTSIPCAMPARLQALADLQRRLEAANRRLLAEEQCRKAAEERSAAAERREGSPRDEASPKPAPSEASTETYERCDNTAHAESNDASQLHALLAAAELKLGSSESESACTQQFLTSTGDTDFWVHRKASEETRARQTAQRQLIQAIKAATAAGAKMKAKELDKNLEASKEEASQRFREVAEAYAALNQYLGGG